MTDRTSKNAPEPTLANGFALGRPEGRSETELDRLIIAAIERLPAAARLYPEVWAWQVSDKVQALLESKPD